MHASQPTTLSSSPRPPNPARVLVVDHDVKSTAILAELLAPECSVISATTGAQALGFAAQMLPDLILLDIIMPDMDGYTLCAQLKADSATAAIPIIFVTGLQEAKLESYGLEHGAADYVTRPFNVDVVRARVRNNIELKRARERLLALAWTDGLTGIANRRAFDEALEHEWKRLARSRSTMVLAMMDVDFFKLYNDRYGHVAGDDCLRHIAGTLAAAMRRPADLAARYGGEEFVCIMPDASLAAATEIVERIKASIAELAIPHAGSSVAPIVTISYGVVSERCSPNTTGAALLKAADARLYEAKAGGRNKIVTSSR